MGKILWIFCYLCFISCENTTHKTIDLSKLERKKGYSILELKLIKAYPNFKTCKDDTLNANLYICSYNEADTILVFETCKNELFDFENVTGVPMIDEANSLTMKNQYIRVKIPPNVTLKNKKYVVGNLGYYRE